MTLPLASLASLYRSRLATVMHHRNLMLDQSTGFDPKADMLGV